MATGSCCERCGAPLEPRATESLCSRCRTSDADGSHVSTHADETPSTRGALDFEPGTRLGDFVVRQRLGYGGMGVVYEALQVSLGRTVALKILPPALMLSPKALVRFHREARAAARLHHSHIVSIFVEGEQDGLCYYAMELVRGISLEQMIRLACARERTPGRESASREALYPTLLSGRSTAYFDAVALLTADVAAALHYAHGEGVVHRDVKPSNIMLDDDGRPKLMDFGLAHVAEQEGVTLTGELVGTPRYMSPEQVVPGRYPVDHRCDIYSLGVTFYELLTLSPPFSGVERDRLLLDIAHGAPRPPRRVSPAVPHDLETICLKAIEKDPAHRFTTAADLEADLRRFVAGQTIRARRTPFLGRAARCMKRNRPLSAAIGAAALLALCLLLLLPGVYRAGQRRRTIQAAQLLAEANLLDSRGDYQDALVRVRRSARLDPAAIEPHLVEARLLLAMREPEQALRLLRELLAHRKEEAAVHHLLALALRDTDPKAARQHSEAAARLRPGSPDALYLRALAAESVEARLELLDQALLLDPAHHASLCAAALARFALGDYEGMELTARAAVAARPRDPIGWQLLAQATHRRGNLSEARRLYTRGLELSPQSPELYEGRRELLHDLGDPPAELADARRAAELSADQPRAWFNLWQALLENGDQASADAIYRAHFPPVSTGRRVFEVALERYVFDTLDAGRALPLVGNGPAATFLGAPQLLAVKERFERYRAVSQRCVRGGFRAAWSPDGHRLAFTRLDRSAIGAALSMPMNSGIGILEIDSGRIRTVVGSGKDPAWSPDGRNLAYVWEATVNDYLGEEVWVVPAAGGPARRLALGGFPSWKSDSRKVIYHSRVEGRLMEVDLVDPNAPVRRLAPTSSWYPTISPDGAKAAFNGDNDLQIIDVETGTLLAAWPLPTDLVCLPSWSPDGRYISVGGPNLSVVGLWIYETDTGRCWRVLDGPVTMGVWSPDQKRIAFDLRGLLWDVWVADWPTDPSLSAVFPDTVSLEEYLLHFAPNAAVSLRLQQLRPNLAHLVAQARSQQRRGATSEARATLRAWAEAGGDPALAQLLGGLFLSELGEPERAADDFRAAQEQWSSGHTAPLLQLTLAQVLVDGHPSARNPRRGAALLQELLTADPHAPSLPAWLALAWHRAGEDTRAAEFLSWAPAPPDANPEPGGAPESRSLAGFVRGLVDLSGSRPAQAWDDYREALSAWPAEGVGSLNTLNTLYHLQFELADALGLLENRFTDEFDGAVRPEWTVRHPIPELVSTTRFPGTLTITTREGDIYAAHTNLANAFLYRLDGIPGDFVATTTVSNFLPAVDWHIAGLLCYGDDDHYVRWGYQHIGERGLGLLREMDGVPGLYRQFALPSPRERLWLRIVRRGSTLGLLSSSDGLYFQVHQEIDWGETPIRAIGLIALNGTSPDTPAIDASFESFRLAAWPSSR